ncbi:MAG: nuclear transport factor 2 family protein [Frankia sp.]
MISDATTQALLDRMDITDLLYRYASSIDRKDIDGVRGTFADDLWAQYGNAEPMVGGDTVAKWIDEATRDCVWQHHLLSVYHVDIAGDTAKALVYHTSHQVFRSDPDTAHVLVARYHDELKRADDGWKLSRLVFEILWGERRTDTTGYLKELGGPGPQI